MWKPWLGWLLPICGEKQHYMGVWRNGRRCGLKIHWLHCRAGSSPATPTADYISNFTSFLLCLLLYIKTPLVGKWRSRLGKWRNGRRAGLRNQCLVRVGSSPTLPIEDRGFGIPRIGDPSGTSSLFYLIFAKINFNELLGVYEQPDTD